MIYYAPPTVPARNKDNFKSYLQGLGVRFIDSYSAVGANTDGTWYSGYQSSDSVHPTSLGSNAILMQYLSDAPEILNI